MISFLRNRVNKIKSAKTIGIYTLSSFLPKAISFASLPLFTYLLTKKDFGIISIFSAYIGFATPIVSLSLLLSTGTDYFKLDRKKFSAFISSTFILPLLAAFLLFLLFCFFSPFLKSSASFQNIFIWALPVSVYCNYLFEQNLILIRNENKPTLYLVLCIIKTIIELGLTLFLIISFEYGWLGRVSGIVIAFIFSGFFAVYYLFAKKYLPGPIDISVIKSELLYSLPATLTQIGVFCITTSDRYFISYYYGDERTGVYSLAATFASILLILCMAFLQVFSPRLYLELSNNPSPETLKRIFKKYCIIILGSFVAVGIFTSMAYSFLINKEFIGGLSFFFLLLVGNAIWCIAYFLYSFLFYYKVKRQILFISLLSIAVSLTANNFLISIYAEKGAAFAAIISCSVVLTVLLIFTKKYFKRA